VQSGDAGSYTVVVTSGSASLTSAAAMLVISTGLPGHLVNLSIRTTAGSGSATLIVGFVAAGGSAGGNALLLVRAAGPVLADYGVAGVLADPRLAINGRTAQIEANDNWDSSLASTFSRIGAFAWTPGSKDAAAALNLPSEAYTAVITGADGATGIALAEIYDANMSPSANAPTLVNVSARSLVGTGESIMIAGFVIGGDISQRVLIRAVGPRLADYGVAGALADPQLQILQGSTQIGSNNDWDASLAATFSQVGAFALAPGSKDAALLVTLAPGVYTAQASGAGGSTGVALVEVYAVP
jgi:hypothetical protein